MPDDSPPSLSAAALVPDGVRAVPSHRAQASSVTMFRSRSALPTPYVGPWPLKPAENCQPVHGPLQPTGMAGPRRSRPKAQSAHVAGGPGVGPSGR